MGSLSKSDFEKGEKTEKISCGRCGHSLVDVISVTEDEDGDVQVEYECNSCENRATRFNV